MSNGMATSKKTHEQYLINEGNYYVEAKIDVANKGRISLEKPFGSPRGDTKDYHFEGSSPEIVEAFAKCALEAVRLSREVYKPEAQSEKTA